MAQRGRKTNAQRGVADSTRKYSTGTMFSITDAGMSELQQAMKDYGEGSGYIVADVLRDYGADRIKEEIHRLLPQSGRSWKGKRLAAKSTDPFKSEHYNAIRMGTISIWTRTKPTYGYLYFPDDGSHTRRHVGNQQFMRRGQDNATSDIINRCLAELVKEF